MKVQEIVTNTVTMHSKSVTVVSRAATGFSDVINNTETVSKSSDMVTTAKETKSFYGQQSSVQQKSSTKKDSESNVSRFDEKKVSNTEDNTVKKTSEQSADKTLDEKGVSAQKKELVENEIKEIIKEDLQVTEEELEAVMSALALSYLDLLEPENLKTLTMSLKGASDITDVLLDDDLSTMLTQVMTDVTTENIAQETGVSVHDVEQFVLQEQRLESESIHTVNDVAADLFKVSEVDENVKEVLVKQPEEENTSGEQKEPQSSLPEVSVVKEVFGRKENMQGETSGQNSPQNQTNIAESVVNNIAGSTVMETVSSDGMITMTRVEVRQVVTQIVQQIRIVIRPEQTDMHMTLNPEHLGRLQLAITSKEGVMTANFTVQNEMVKQALEAQIQDLRNAFEEQGLKVEAVEVMVSTFEFTQSDQADGHGEPSEQKKQRGSSLNLEDAFLEEFEQEDLEEKAVAAISGTGNNVNYTA